MSERFSRIFYFSDTLYEKGSPVIIKAGALLNDNEGFGLIAQLKLQSISDNPIKFVKVEILCLDSIGRTFGDALTFEYLDLNVSRGSIFGTQTAIRIPFSATRSFETRIVEVGFCDNTAWTTQGRPLTVLPEQSPIASVIPDEYVITGYKSIFGENANFQVAQAEDLWLCACGEINHNNEPACRACKAALVDLRTLDVNTLKDEGTYTNALSLYQKGDTPSIEKAIEEFNKIPDYKDSSELIEDCKDKISGNKIKRKKVITLTSVISGCAVLVVLLSVFLFYPLINYWNGEYSTYIDMYNVETFEIPEGTTEILEGQFLYCDSLKKVVIPDSVTKIGDYAFMGCSNLRQIEFGNNLEVIGNNAFQSCGKLAEVNLPESLTEIGIGAFYKCHSITSIVIPAKITKISSSAFYDCTNLYNVTIPDGITSIGDYAFNGTALTSITLPESLKSIGYGVFGNCKYVKNIEFKSTNLETVGSIFDSFTGSDKIFVTIADNVTAIPAYFFAYLTRLSAITFENNSVCQTIGASAFRNCNNLTRINLPDSITFIDKYAFENCSALTYISIGKSTKKIESNAFYGCTALETVYFNATEMDNFSSSYSKTSPFSISTEKGISLIIGKDVIKVPAYLFYDSSYNENILKSLSFEAGSVCESIGAYAFYECSELSGILVIPESVVNIGSYAFYRCKGLSGLTLGNGVTNIEMYAFSDCDGLTTLIIPSCVTSIGNYAFSDCDGLTTLSISYGVKTLGNYAFYSCGGLTTVSIPGSITEIGNNAFANSYQITSITIGHGVVSIGAYAFSGCSIETIDLPDSITEIGGYAFSDCDELQSITMSNSIKSLGTYAFKNCEALTEITIPKSIKTIGSYVFSGCSSLTSIKYCGSKSEWGAIDKEYKWNYNMAYNYTITYNNTNKNSTEP